MRLAQCLPNSRIVSIGLVLTNPRVRAMYAAAWIESHSKATRTRNVCVRVDIACATRLICARSLRNFLIL